MFGQRCAASGKLRGLEGSRIFVEFLVEGWGAREREREGGGKRGGRDIREAAG